MTARSAQPPPIGPAVSPAMSVQTPSGDAEVLFDRPTGSPRALLVLGHGAGGELDAPDLVAVTAAAVSAGVAVARVRQPYRVAGRRAPAPAAQLDAAWIAVVTALRAGSGGIAGGVTRAKLGSLPVVVGGRSSGARVACRTALSVGARGVLALAFPLHPPGRPDRSRAGELDVGVPLLVLQGTRDPFGGPEQFPPDVTVREVVGAQHRLVAPGLPQAAADAVAWIRHLTG